MSGLEEVKITKIQQKDPLSDGTIDFGSSMNPKGNGSYIDPLSLRELPPTDRSFASVMQKQDLETNKENNQHKSLMGSLSEELSTISKTEYGKVHSMDKSAISAHKEDSLISKAQELGIHSESVSPKTVIASVQDFGQKIENANKLVAQLDTIRNQLKSSGGAAGQQGLSLINELDRNSQMGNQLNVLQRDYGDLINTNQTTDTKGVEGKKGVQSILGQFGHFLTDAQNQFNTVSIEMQGHVGQMTQAQLFGYQVKFAGISQQIDFFSGALSKCLEGVKTVLNVQS